MGKVGAHCCSVLENDVGPDRPMSFAAILFAPLVVLLPVAGSVEPAGERAEPLVAGAEDREPEMVRSASPVVVETGVWPTLEVVAESFRQQTQNQVRIEQQTTIRISPRPQRAPERPNFLVDLPNRDVAPRMVERNIGRCVSASGISGVQADAGNRLLLFMRDRRIVSAQLERACRGRDFYSGFYLSRSTDGQLCVDRDTLLSRSGANCKLTRLRQLVESGD
jgi:hypothetical protein